MGHGKFLQKISWKQNRSSKPSRLVDLCWYFVFSFVSLISFKTQTHIMGVALILKYDFYVGEMRFKNMLRYEQRHD